VAVLIATDPEILHVVDVPEVDAPAVGPPFRSAAPSSGHFVQSRLVWPRSPHSQHLTDVLRFSGAAEDGFVGVLRIAGAARGIGLGLRSSNLKA
jgi:hypothetical protein